MTGEIGERTNVQSSNLLWVEYNEENTILRVGFRNGSIYEYEDVPEEIYLGLLNASSKGRYHHHYIRRGDYPYRRIH